MELKLSNREKRDVFPDRVAAQIVKMLKRQSTSDGIQGAQRYFKGTISTYGIKAPVLRSVAKYWLSRVRQNWTLSEVVDLCDILFRESELDSKTVGVLILSEFSETFDSNLLPIIKRWTIEHCDNWAIIDGLGPWILAPLIGKYPNLIPQVLSWSDAENMWLRRLATVSFIPHVRKGKYLDAAYEIAGALLGDDEDLMHKAVGWLLREAGKADSKRLEEFLLTNGPDIPRTTVRYAIERFPESERKRLLQETRGQKTLQNR